MCFCLMSHDSLNSRACLWVSITVAVSYARRHAIIVRKTPGRDLASSMTFLIRIRPRIAGELDAPLASAAELECSPTAVFFQAEDGIRDLTVTGVQTCALPI